MMVARRVASIASIAGLLAAIAGCGDSLIAAEQLRRAAAMTTPEAGAGPDAAPTPEAPDADDVFVTCGHTQCRNVTQTAGGTLLVAYACCVDPTRSRCGLVATANACVERDQPGTLDPTCATLPDTALGTLAGCCRPDGTCGVLEERFGLGCAQIPLVSQLSPCTPK
jgi:hypothetical protein